jgi:hypothetical protein
VILRDTLIFLIILFVALFAWLKYGISTDKITFGQYEIDGLYIKLDKKLTLKADKIVLPERKEKVTFNNIDKTFDRIKELFTYFDYIDLNEINFKNNKLKFLFADNVLYITTDDYEIAGNIERKGNVLIADVSLFYIKKEQANIVGKLKYFLHKDRLETEGAFEAFNIKGNFAAFKDNDSVSFAVKSDEFSDLKTVTYRLPIKEILKSWIADRIVLKEYKLNSLVGKARIVDKKLKLDISALRAVATGKDVTVNFHDGLDPLYAKGIKMVFKDRTLYFDVEEPIYKNKNLDGSKVSISNLKKGHIALLNLDLHVKSQVDDTVQEILQAYKLKIPVTQKGAEVSADINLTIALKKKYKSPEEKAKHKIKVLVDLKLPKGEVTLNKGIKLPVTSGDVHVENGIATLSNIKLKEKWYAGVVNGKIYLKDKKADLKLNVENFSIGDGKNTYFDLKDKKLGLKLDYGKQSAEIPDLKIEIVKKDKEFIIKLLDLKMVLPYVKNVDIQIDGGKLDILTSDFHTYTYAGILKRYSCFFYDNRDVCHTIIPCKGKVSKNGFSFIAFNNRLNIDMTKSIIKINGLNIDLKSFFDVGEKRKSKAKDAQGKTVNIFGKNSKLRYGEFMLLTDKYTIKVTPGGNIYAHGNLGSDKVKLVKEGKNLKIDALRIHDRMLHPLLDFNGLHNGLYTFKSHGDPKKVMHGEIIIEGGVMRDFKAYNNTLAFINTIPALATLNRPGFSKKGFVIKKGLAKYRKIGEKIIFDSIEVEGTSASFVGKGEIDLKTKKINMDFTILTAREFGKVIGNIPVLGYILMGEDKSMTVGLKITGSLSKPIVKTSATKEFLKLPLDLIRRTLQSPAHIKDTKPKPKSKPKKKPLLKIKKPKIFNKLSP